MDRFLSKVITALSLSPLVFVLSGCASTGKSIGLGAGSGAVLGAGAGAIADPGPGGENRVRNILIGTAAGGILGAGVGYAISEHVKNERHEAEAEGKKTAEEEAKQRAQGGPGDQPRLVAQTEARWVRGQARGGTFVPGHFEYQITEGAHWEVTP